MTDDGTGPGDLNTDFDIPDNISESGDDERLEIRAPQALELQPAGALLRADTSRIATMITVNALAIANDNPPWPGDSREESRDFCSDFDAATLADGSAVAIWTGSDQIIHAKYFPAPIDDGVEAPAAAQTAAINALLSDLGEMGRHGDDRIKLTPYGQSGFAAFWVAEFGLTAALIGKVYSLHDAPGTEAGSAGWTVKDFGAISVPRSATHVSANISHDGSAIVSYDVHSGGTSATIYAHLDVVADSAAVDDLNGTSEADQINATAGDPSSAEYHVTVEAAVEVPADQLSPAGMPDGDLPAAAAMVQPVPLDAPALVTEGIFELAPGSATHQTIAGGDADTVAQSHARTVVTSNGTVVVLYQEPGDTSGSTVLKFTQLNSDGSPVTNRDGAPVVTIVTTQAVVEDEGSPNLDLGPAMAAAGDGVAIAYVTHHNGGDVGGYKLNVMAYDGHGEALTDGPVVIGASDNPSTTYSDFDVAAYGSDSEPAPEDSGEETVSSPQHIAVVWVENADPHGYGSLMGQRLDLGSAEENDRSGNSGSGSDEDNSGSDEGAFHLPSGSGVNAFGRAPQVSGCNDSGLVLAWIEETSPGSGVEVVAGAVLGADNGSPLLSINLVGLIDHGLVAGTEPSLMTDDAGDIVIGWLQGNDKDGFEAATAVYRAVEGGGWIAPLAASILYRFDDEPDHLNFTLQDSAGVSILLSWSDDRNQLSAASFDLEGSAVGDVFRIGRSDGGSNSVGSDDVSIASMPDGQIVVVYTEADGHDTDIGAMIVQTASAPVEDSSPDLPAETSSGSSSSPASDDNEGNYSNIVFVDFDNDLIRIIDLEDSDVSGFTSSVSVSGNSGSGSTNSNSGSNSGSNSDDTGDGNSGPGSSPSHDNQTLDTDAIQFASGYGNDTADYHEDEHLFDVSEPVADLFDALQFANALFDDGNGDVLVFDTTNLVIIRDFETL